jgi:hypothetical protein
MDKKVRGGVLFMDERIKIAAAVIVLSLIGAFAVSFLTSVPKEKYDTLAKNCEQEKATAAGALDAEKAKSRFAAEELRGCEDDKKGAESLIDAKNAEIAGQLAVIGDAGLTGLWLEVKGCQTLLGCQNAKEKFTGAINTRMSLYANETVEIVKPA